MTGNSKAEHPGVQRFEAARLWESNLYGATVAGFGAVALLFVVAGILLYSARRLDVFLTAGGMIASVVLGLLCWLPGNLVAAHPR